MVWTSLASRRPSTSLMSRFKARAVAPFVLVLLNL